MGMSSSLAHLFPSLPMGKIFIFGVFHPP
uniref:Uncharacterized protein n=1 Tax=Arundo donax TaxID=35708 RepID=A0A0A8Y3H2_ARUDO